VPDEMSGPGPTCTPDDVTARGTLSASRRAALSALAAGCLLAITGLPATARAATIRKRTLDAFLDMLLPEDRFGPSASALGTGDALIGFAPEGTDFHRLLALGTQWLDRLAARPFADLPPQTRTDVLRYLEGADVNEIPGRFYRVVRQAAMELYHARAETIAGLPLNPAPQPEGYPPPWS